MEYSTSCGVKERMRIAWVFDLDNTLIYTDLEKNKRTFFRNLDVLSYDEKMKNLFQLARYNDEKVFILTGRHPDLRHDIADLFDMYVGNIFCRQNDLEREKEEKFVNGGADEIKYIEQMNDWKVSKLNEIAIHYDLVLYFDDGFNWYVKRQDIYPNVFIMPTINESYKNLEELKLWKNPTK